MPKVIVYADSTAFTQKSVHRIFQDATGFLWFGTQDGAVRFDGAQWRRVSSSDGLGANHITAIAEGPVGELYFGAVGGGLTRVERGDYQRQLDHQDVRDVVCSGDTVWAATAQGIWSTKGHIACGDTVSLCLARDGRLWAATRGGVVVVVDGRVVETRRDLALASFPASCVFEDAGGDIWVGTLGGGLVRLPADGGVARGYTSADGLPNDHIMCGVRGSGADELWVGTWGAGVSHVRIRPLGGRCAFKTLSSKDGIGNDNVRSLCVSSDGSLWIGTGGRGATRYQPKDDVQPFVSYTKRDGLAHNMVASIAQDSTGRYWFGTFGGGVSSFAPASRMGKLWQTYTTREGLVHDTVRAVHADAWDRLWFGSAGGGLCRFRPELNEWKRVTTADGLSGNVVRTLQPMRNGQLWVGTDGGISVFSPEHMQHVRNIVPQDGLPAGTVLSIVEHGNEVWVGLLGGGVARLIDHVWHPLPQVPAGVTCLLPLDNGAWLIGTYGQGLVIFQHGQLRTLRQADGLPHDIVYGLVRDLRGNVFGTSVRGVFSLHWQGDQPVLRTFDQTDGLADDECNGAAVYCDRGGRLWFGTIGGVSELTPSALPQEVPDASAVVTAFARTHYSFTFEYAVVDYRAPSKVVFQCRLDGLEPEWLPPTTQRSLRYTNLAPGRYTFMVRARGFSGMFGPEARLEFQVA